MTLTNLDKFIVVGDRILIKPQVDSEKTNSGLYLPAGVKEKENTIKGGMIPKVETCIHAVESGVEAAVILDGRVPHAMLLEIFTQKGVGTMVKRG